MADDDDRVIATGTLERGFAWALEVGGTDEEYWTGLRLTGPDGRDEAGGMAGPKLWGDDLLNTYTARNDDGPLTVVVRADPTVYRVLLVDLDGAENELTACGDGVVDGLRFYIGFARPSTPGGPLGLREVRGLNASGAVVETYDLSFWDHMDRH